MNLEEIKSPIANDLLLFNELLKKHLSNKNLLLDRILKYVAKKKGKQIRPILVLLSARLCGSVTDQSLRAAILLELLHTASLVHDDVVDNAFKRRGLFSVNAIWRNKLSVLTGDFLLSQTLLKTVQYNDYKLLEVCAASVKHMSEGEILQIETSRKNLIDEKVYLRIIYNKTASLFASCCQAGAITATVNNKDIYKSKMIGNCIGMIFQIKDDILDITSQNLNKPSNSDFLDRKVTLPLIYAIKNAPRKSQILKIIKSNKRNYSMLQLITNFIVINKGIEDAYNKIEFYQNKAIKILDSFNNSPSKESLKQLILYVSKRDY